MKIYVDELPIYNTSCLFYDNGCTLQGCMCENIYEQPKNCPLIVLEETHNDRKRNKTNAKTFNKMV